MGGCCSCLKKSGKDGLRRSIIDSDEYNAIDMQAISELGTFPSIPISYKELKHELRLGLMAEARTYWWPYLPRILPGTIVTTYPKLKEIGINMYEWAKKTFKDLPNLFEISDETDRTYEIMLLLGSQYDLEEPGLVVPVIGMLALFIPSPEVIFSTACEILDRQDWYLSPTPSRHRMKLFSFRQLISNFLPEESAKMEKIGALRDEFLNLIFIDYFLPIMPIAYCAKVFDIFLLEGYKVLHRVGLALLSICKQKLEDESINGAGFWNYVKDYCNTRMDWVNVINVAFSMGSSSLSILSSSSTSLTRAALIRLEIQAKTALGDALHLPLNLNYKEALKNTSSANVLNANVVENVSKLLTPAAGARLRMFLPDIMNLEGFSLAFSTQQDGWSLGTLYAKLEGLSPCLIIIKTLQHDALVAAFITSPISPPSGAVRGDGNCFVCRLDGPEAACYRWVGRNDSVSSMGATSPGGNFTRSQFSIFRESNIMIGGSEVRGENAIYIDSDLSSCFFGASDTFGNPQLAPNDANGRSAPVADLEVLCGKRSMMVAVAKGDLDDKKRQWSVSEDGDPDHKKRQIVDILRYEPTPTASGLNPLLDRSRATSGDYTALAGNEV